MNNRWNKIIYKLWAPIYDRIFNSGQFLKTRKQIFEEFPFDKHHKVLVVGVGTGADLEIIHSNNLDITAIDYSPEMLKQARAKFGNTSIQFLEMDAQNLQFDNGSFDIVIASLILSVVPDGEKCFQEMERVLKENGKIIIFDKFKPNDENLTLLKKLLRPIIKIMGTDIGLGFEEVYQNSSKNLQILEDQPVMINGMYRKIVVTKAN